MDCTDADLAEVSLDGANFAIVLYGGGNRFESFPSCLKICNTFPSLRLMDLRGNPPLPFVLMPPSSIGFDVLSDDKSE